LYDITTERDDVLYTALYKSAFKGKDAAFFRDLSHGGMLMHL
jgi:hypothetical protein